MVQSQSFLNQFQYHSEGAYFDFRYKRNSRQLTEIPQFSDAFVKLVNRDFFKADFNFPIHVFVSEDRVQYKSFVVRELHIDDPPGFGVYVPTHNLFATYEDSGMGTFAHEIMHPLVERNLSDRPLWAKEGIPTFFEKFYGYWKNDELIVYWGFQNPWRIAEIGTNLTRLDLRQIITDPKPSTNSSPFVRNESELRMVSVFLWEKGRFKRFLNLIAAHDKAGFQSYLEAAMGMPIEKILPLWQSYLEEVASNRASILTLPVSTILPDETAFRTFVMINKISLRRRNQSD